MVDIVLSDMTTSITEFKKNPMVVINESQGMPVAVLNHNKPAFYCISAELFESMLEQLEDLQLAELAKEGLQDATIEVDINDL